MTLKKKLIVASAAGALAVVAAAPAMALENEFHGMYKSKFFVSNVDDGASGALSLTRSGATAANYFEQRARLMYIAKANDDLKLVTHFEIDSVFGDKAQGSIVPTVTETASATGAGTHTVTNSGAFRGSGGALEADAVNLETKWVYLDFNIPSTPVNTKVGIQPIKDALKGTFLDADAAGILASAKFGSVATALGYFRAYEGLNGGFVAPRGTDNLDIALLHANYEISKDLKVGAAYYLYSDYRNATPLTDHVIGLNAEAKFGPALVNGFVAYQGGSQKVAGAPSITLSAFAANVTGKVKAGPGTAKASFLYASGDKKADSVNHSWFSVSQQVAGPRVFGPAANSFNDSGMMLLNRNTSAGGTSTDRAIIQTTNNGDQGAVIFAVGYDAAITPKFYANVNAGIGLTAENNTGVSHPDRSVGATTAANNGSHFQGTEVNVETGYKLYDNLTASLQAAYVVLGPYYTNTASRTDDPVNPYTARVVLSYAF